MTKRPAPEDGLPNLKRARTSTSQDKATPAKGRRGRKSLPIGASLDSSKTSDAPSSAGIRRRMNPESLAGRLGPELVKELEDLLEAGITEMPSFTVRQEIQQRYNIDRRHIYDWFHNKGLRVTTSEKREERRVLRARDSIHVPTTRTMERNRTMKNAEATSPPSPVAQAESESSESDSCSPRSSASSTSGFIGNQLSHDAAYFKERSPEPSVSQSLDYADTFFASPVDEPLESTLNTVFCQPPAPSDRDPTTDGLDASTKGYVDRTSHWIAEQQKIPYSPRLGVLSPVPGSEKACEEILDAILPLDNGKVLPQHQREAYYRSLSDVLPPARGIEECVGTYKEYMSRQGQKYYDRLIHGPGSDSKQYNSTYSPASSHISPVLPSLPATSPSIISHRTLSFTRSLGPSPTEDFTKWLLHHALPHTPAHTPAFSESATTASSSALWSRPSPSSSFDHRHAREPSCCMDLAEILESPVLRARHPTHVPVPRYAPGEGVENASPVDPVVAYPQGPCAAPSMVGYAYGAHAYPVVFGAGKRGVDAQTRGAEGGAWKGKERAGGGC